MKIFLGGILTETNTFSNIPTNITSFEESLLTRGLDEAMANPMTASQMQPLQDFARSRNAETVVSVMAFAQPSAAVVQADYESLRDELLNDLTAAMPVDLVLLSLHGAMVAQETWDCEGDILHRVRDVVGPDVPILSVLDPHAHLTSEMVDNGTLLAFMKEYPHTDGPDRWNDLVELSAGLLDGSIKPTPAVVDLQLLGDFPTTFEPFRSVTNRFYAAEQRPGILSTSFVHGFPWGDTPETGSKVLVYADNNPALAAQVARELADAVLEHREAAQTKYVALDETLDAIETTDGLLVISDSADNAGGGAPSDSSFVLQRLRERGIHNVAIGLFYDPELVKFAFATGVGGQIEGRIGGKMGRFSGPVLDFKGTVRGLKRQALQQMFGGESFAPMGDAAWIEIDGINVVVVSLRGQCYDPTAFETLGIDLAKLDAVVVKSSTHFRAGFEPIAARIIRADTPGTLTMDFASLDYRRMNKPRYPIQNPPAVSSPLSQ